MTAIPCLTSTSAVTPSQPDGNGCSRAFSADCNRNVLILKKKNNDTPAEILEEQTELQKWMKFLQPGDTFDADDPSELETSGGDDSFYSSGDESGPQPEWMDDPDDSRWEEDDSVREPTSSDEDRWPGEVSSGSDDTDDSD